MPQPSPLFHREPCEAERQSNCRTKVGMAWGPSFLSGFWAGKSFRFVSGA